MTNLDYPKKLLELGDYEGAISELKRIVVKDKDNLDAWLLLGCNIKDELHAKYCYKQVLRLDPNNTSAKKYLEPPGQQKIVPGEPSLPLNREISVQPNTAKQKPNAIDTGHVYLKKVCPAKKTINKDIEKRNSEFI